MTGRKPARTAKARAARGVEPVPTAEAAAVAEPAATAATTPASGAAPAVEAAPIVETVSMAEPADTPETTATVQLVVSRFKPGDSKPHFDRFDCTPEAGATVLDVLIEIRSHRDPSLVLRHSCMHASCGACGVRVNGREVLACDTRIASLPTPTVKIEPLANQNVVADLATDLVDSYARLEEVGLPLVRSAQVDTGVESTEGVAAYSRFEDCIECGLCLSACPISRADQSYLGPAALAAATRLGEEPRGRPLGPILALATEPDSVWRCRDAIQCTAVCPSAVDPAAALFRLRRRVAFERVKSLFGRGQAATR
jgi:succinate dehydrogenase / fumarate reductase iron-sulfur subunit